MLEWEREIQKKKKRKRKRLINQEDQISELTFNFHGALLILTFYKNELTLFTEKKEEKNKKTKKKQKKKGKEKKKRKSFLFESPCQKS